MFSQKQTTSGISTTKGQVGYCPFPGQRKQIPEIESPTKERQRYAIHECLKAEAARRDYSNIYKAPVPIIWYVTKTTPPAHPVVICAPSCRRQSGRDECHLVEKVSRVLTWRNALRVSDTLRLHL